MAEKGKNFRVLIGLLVLCFIFVGQAFSDNSTSYYAGYSVDVIGTVTGVKKIKGPGWGVEWNSFQLVDDSGRTYYFAFGPVWWGFPSKITQGSRIEVIGFMPPCFRGSGYYVVCTIKFPDTGSVYNVRPCGPPGWGRWGRWRRWR